VAKKSRYGDHIVENRLLRRNRNETKLFQAATSASEQRANAPAAAAIVQDGESAAGGVGGNLGRREKNWRGKNFDNLISFFKGCDSQIRQHFRFSRCQHII
jgi:hypothetical protein